MCYFSTHGRSREAKEDEVLVVKRQPYGRNWLVSPDDCSTAVCVKDGTEVELLYIPKETRDGLGLPQEARATFRQWWGRGRRDVLVLESGRSIPLQKLADGQVVRLTRLPPSSRKAARRETSVYGRAETLASAR